MVSVLDPPSPVTEPERELQPVVGDLDHSFPFGRAWRDKDGNQDPLASIQSIVRFAVAEAVIRHPECQTNYEVVAWAEGITGYKVDAR